MGPGVHPWACRDWEGGRVKPMKRVLIFANPIAGRGRGGDTAEMLRRAIAQRGYEASVVLSRAETSGFRCEAGEVSAAIVIGGDGTLRSVAQWVMDGAGCKGEAGAGAFAYPLLLVPMGTANLMASHLGIAWHDRRLGEEVCGALETRRVVHVDAASANGALCLLVAGVGFDAAVIHELSRRRARPISKASYLRPIWRALGGYRFGGLSVTVDGRRVFETAPALALVGNVREYGTGFAMLPMARSDDGLLDVCVMPCGSRRELVGLFLSAATGRHVRRKGVVYARGKRIEIESAQALPVQVDGEAAGFTPLRIDLLPWRIPFIVRAEHE